MKSTVNLYDFRNAFENSGRTNFSHEGQEVLFDYLEECERDSGEEIELDVVALCCEFAEDTPKEIASKYDIDVTECEDEDEVMDTVMDYLQDNTQVCGETSNSIVYQQF